MADKGGGGQCTKGTEQSVHGTLSMRSILLLGGLGSMHPQEILKNT